jgi:hypothetical protein
MKLHWLPLVSILAACVGTATGVSLSGDDVVVTSVVPDAAHRGGPVTLRVLGAGFDAGSSVSFFLNDAPADAIAVDSVRFVSTTELLVYINIKLTAAIGRYGVRVTTGRGSRGTGNEKFNTLIDVEVLSPGWAYAINNSGTIVGYMTFEGTGFQRAFWKEPGSGAVVLPGGGNETSIAYDISDNNLIVGVRAGVPARWKADAARTLEELFPQTSSEWNIIVGEAKRANESGLIVGWVNPNKVAGGAQRAFCWRDSGWTILAPKDSNYRSSGVLWDVNEPGDAVGRVIRLTPTPISEALVVHCHAAVPSITILQDPAQQGALAHAIADDGTVYGQSGGQTVRWRLVGPDQWGPPEVITGVPFLPERVTAGGRLVGGAQGVAYIWDSKFGLVSLSNPTEGDALAWFARDSGPGTTVQVVGSAQGNSVAVHWIGSLPIP